MHSSWVSSPPSSCSLNTTTTTTTGVTIFNDDDKQMAGDNNNNNGRVVVNDLMMPNHDTAAAAAGCNDDDDDDNSSSMILIRRPHLQCNTSTSTCNRDIKHHIMLCNIPCPNNKRKADNELDLEEKANDNNNNKVNDKATEAEESREGQSEISTKTDVDSYWTNTCPKASEAQKPDYIHVRARRGQATDSHSLAERARREKISKKMKCLQDLVPGCERVVTGGKAGMLDEIINYVRSLQKQVEFLSMKLATLKKPRHEFNFDNLLAQEMTSGHMSNLMTQPTKLAQDTKSPCFPYNQMQQVLEAASTNCGTTMTDQSQGTSRLKDEGIINSSFIDPPSIHQHLSGWDSEWPNNNHNNNNNQFRFNFH